MVYSEWFLDRFEVQMYSFEAVTFETLCILVFVRKVVLRMDNKTTVLKQQCWRTWNYILMMKQKNELGRTVEDLEVVYQKFWLDLERDFFRNCWTFLD